MTKLYLLDINELISKDNKPPIYEKAVLFLPKYRQEKVEKLKPFESKLRSIAVGLLLQFACKDFGIEGQDENIILSEKGKPEFAAAGNIKFNLSHSGDLAICVMSDECEALGCDIEIVDYISKNFEGIIKRYFTDEEQVYFAEISDLKTKQKEFYRLWTQKEALSKAKGTGISEIIKKTPTNQIDCGCHVQTFEYDLYDDKYFYSIASLPNTSFTFSVIKRSSLGL